MWSIQETNINVVPELIFGNIFTPLLLSILKMNKGIIWSMVKRVSFYDVMSTRYFLCVDTYLIVRENVTNAFVTVSMRESRSGSADHKYVWDENLKLRYIIVNNYLHKIIVGLKIKARLGCTGRDNFAPR